MFVDAKHEAAVKTLEAAGYTYHGGELWKPPLGPSAKPFLDRIAELEAALRTIASTFDETWLNGSIERQAGDLARAALQPKPTKE